MPSLGDMGIVRRTLTYSGRVQGVGFRYTTCHVAERYDVRGYVKNLPDGRVELTAEGEPEELDRFAAAVSAEMAALISETTVSESQSDGQFERFEVRY